MPDLGYWDTKQKIWRPKDPKAYVPKVALFECKCGMRYWKTKNIGYFGARSIYNYEGGCEWMRSQHNFGTIYFHDDGRPFKVITTDDECKCPSSDLRIAEDLMEHIVNCKECQEYGY